MSDEQAGLLFKTILKYVNNLEVGDIDTLTKVVFSKIKKTMDEDNVKYDEICEKRKKAADAKRTKVNKMMQMDASASK
jgi:hypothetical protein